jgi:hypothetical protein
MNPSALSTIFQGVGVIVLAAGVVALFNMASRLARIETWMIEHEKKDESIQGTTVTELTRIRNRLDRMDNII